MPPSCSRAPSPRLPGVRPPSSSLYPCLSVLPLALRHAAQDPDPDHQQHEERADGYLVGSAAETAEQARDDDAVDERTDDGAELPDEPIEPKHLADASGRRQAQEHEPIDDADAAEPGAEQRSGEQERDGRQESGDDDEP